MKNCPYCRKRIDVGATKCAYCGSVFDGAQMEAGRKQQSRERWRKFWMVIIIMAAGLWWLVTPGNVERLGREAAEKEWRQKHGSLPEGYMDGE